MHNRSGPSHAGVPVCQASQMAKLTKPLTIGSTVLGVTDVARARDFWTAALGYVPRDEADDTWQVLIPPDGAGAQLALMRSDTPAQDRPRVHLDLYASDQAAEVRRLAGLGAREVADWAGYSEDSDFVVLEDPDGNRFCVVDKSG
jgi:catechol 2,3-dioxygenase-like lactoylglutathione lyase family enzyme